MKFLPIILWGLIGLSAPAFAQPATMPTQMSLPQLRLWTGDFDGMLKRRVVRILVPYSKTLFFVDRGRQFGVVAELAQQFEEWLNKRLKSGALRVTVGVIPVPRDELLQALKEGRGDIVAGGLTVTPERLAEIDFAEPWSSRVDEIVVTGPSSAPLARIEDLADRETFVREDSSYATHLRALSQTFVANGQKPIIIKRADGNLEDEDILEMVNAGLLPYAIVDDHKATLWSSVFKSLTPHRDLAVNTGGSVAWAIRKNSPLLKEQLAGFVREHKLGTAFGNGVMRRFYADNKIVRNAYSEAEMKRFHELVDLFNAHGKTYGFDALMLMAQGFQESQLDQTRRSARGAVGVMQVLPKTAAAKPISIIGVEADANKNIQAGSAYLRHLVDAYIGDDPAVDARNRTLFAFAGYNAGPGNLRKFRRIAEEKGLNPNIWFGNVEHAAAQVVGHETPQYVSNIYKYFIAYSLASEREASRRAIKDESFSTRNDASSIPRQETRK
jgi:membrane-bound lytic murein transglycosylase MltF